jgi:cytochrome c5
MPRLYMDYCAVCHLPGIHGAPKVGDRTEWTRRVRLGLNATTRVESRNGVVAMIGIVEDAEVARLAYDAVKRIPGIQKIDNRLMSGHQMGWD